MEALRFPSWRDVGIPEAIPDAVRSMSIRYGDLLSYLLAQRVFLDENKLNYAYICNRCGHQKFNLTPFDSYIECKRCNHSDLQAVAYWTLNRKNARPFNRHLVSMVCNRMAEHHDAYIGRSCPDVFNMTWSRENSYFGAKFLGGDEVFAGEPALAVAKAAICCPFLWDSTFDFTEKRFKERSENLSLSHTIYQWCNNG